MLSFRGFPFRAVVFLMLVCALPLFSQSEAEVETETNDLVCSVKGIAGTVQVRRAKVRRERAVNSANDSGWTDVRLNMILREKDIIRTMAQSEVRLETPEGSQIKLGENTTVEMLALKYRARDSKTKLKITGSAVEGHESGTVFHRQTATTTNTKVKLVGGSMVTNVKKLVSSKSSFEIETPTATAAVRGTTVELDVKNGLTEVKVFDGKVLVAPAGTKKFVEVNDRQAVDIAPNQKTVTVREVPAEYKPKSTRLKNEPPPQSAPSGRDRADAGVEEPVSVQFSLKLDGPADTISCYARDSIIVKGVVSPPTARVRINNKQARPDEYGAFTLALTVPSDSGVYPLKITANDKEVSETILRTLKVAHVYTEIKLASPVEGQVFEKPEVEVSGTAAPGSIVNVMGKSITVNRNGTFSGEAVLSDKEGDVKMEIEIVDKENNAVWFIRNVKYQKTADTKK
ncbi:MAG: FecR family protein [Chitinispirillales bacterium]|jgi:hypothetical protein|nr:FecR family protein [Chitinispirillales bacterium]